MGSAVLDHHPEAGVQQNLQGRLDRRVPFPYHLKLFFYMADKSHILHPFLQNKNLYTAVHSIETKILRGSTLFEENSSSTHSL